jgi:hypothetical protein
LINDEIEFELAELFDADPIDVAMDAIRRWYDLMGRDEFARQKWVEAVYPVMLELINCATLDLRARLRAALSEQGWLDAPHADVRYIAQAMVSRSYMLDGVVIDVPAERYGAILLDASSRSRHDPYYYQTAFILAQRLSAVTPVRLYHMGAQRQIAEVGLEREEPDNLLTPKKLRSTRQRDRLIMPFFEPLPDDLAVLDSERCHYVLVLTPTDAIYPDIEERIDEDVIDLLDILELATSNISAGSQQILDDPFATDAEKEAARQAIAAVDWPWSGKLFLISTDRRAVVRDLTHALRTLVQDGQVRNLQNKPESILDVIDVSSGFLFNADLDKIEMRLNQRIAKNLYTLSAADWQRDLAVMWSRQNAPPDAPVREMLDQWVNQLGLVDHARHPDDVSRAIAWTVLAVARTDLRLAVEIVSGWLGSDNDLTANMGLACAKLLFNFYDLADDLVSDHERYVCLLDLIEPFVKLERGPAEFRQVLRVIMRWARYSVWADQFVASVDRDSPLLNGIHAITDRKNIPHLRWLVGVHETLLAIADWLIRSRLDWERFEYLIEQVWVWHTDTPGYLRTDSIGDFTNRLGHRNVTPDMIAEIDDMIEMLGEWRFSMPYLLDLFERNIMAIVEQPHDTIREWRRNVKRVADSMRLELYNRTDLPMPKLADGKRYGVIMVDVSPGSQEMLHTITGFVRNFQRRAQEENLDILITIHRVGRTELVYSSRNSPPRRRELRPEGTPHFAPIIGPTLERYDPADVAFVLVATTDRILDWDDWVDDDRWMARLHIHTSRMRRWMRFQTENQTKQHVKENILQLTDDIVDQLKQGVF